MAAMMLWPFHTEAERLCGTLTLADKVSSLTRPPTGERRAQFSLNNQIITKRTRACNLQISTSVLVPACTCVFF